MKEKEVSVEEETLSQEEVNGELWNLREQHNKQNKPANKTPQKLCQTAITRREVTHTHIHTQ